MKISLDALELLDAIDLKGSFAAAAQALHRVPSAVTHAVRKLEADLNVALFERQGRRATLTPAGQALLEEGRRLLASAGELECRVRRIATGWESELRIAVDPAVGSERLLPLIADFYRENTGTRLRLLNETLGGTWDALLTGRADLAVGASGEPPPGMRLITRPLGQLELVFAIAPGHPLAAAPEPLAADAVAAHRGIVLADTSRQLAGRVVALASGQDTLTVADMAAKLAAQLAGLGVGHLPREVAEREAAAGRLVVKRLEKEVPPMPLHLAWRPDRQGKALAWFAERLGAHEWHHQPTRAGAAVSS